MSDDEVSQKHVGNGLLRSKIKVLKYFNLHVKVVHVLIYFMDWS